MFISTLQQHLPLLHSTLTPACCRPACLASSSAASATATTCTAGQTSTGHLPVPAGFGNHDGGNTTAGPEECNLVRRQLRLRNLLRLPEPVSLSSNALHYSWDWGPLHLVHLNLYPGGWGKGLAGLWSGRVSLDAQQGQQGLW
jgi:hypothetical protein